MYIDNKFTTETDISEAHHAFGIDDKKGRSVGAYVEVFEVDVVPEGDDRAVGYGSTSLDFGHHFGMRTYATRAGDRFGASSRDRHFPSASKRAKAVAKYLKNAKKRAAKNVSHEAAKRLIARR